MKFVSILLAVLFLGSATYAQDEKGLQVAEQATGVFEKWMKKHNIREGAIAISLNGEPVATNGYGRKASDPAPVASLSKAITAVCVIKAAREANIFLRTPISKILPDLLAKYPPADPRLGQITLSQLIAQDSGIHSVYHRKELLKLRTVGKENKEWQFSKITKEQLGDAPGTGYHYSNANFLIQGLAIEAMTGEAYEPYCQKAVFEPVGITDASLWEPWRALTSYGGWAISAPDYAAFVDFYFADNKIMGQTPLIFEPRAQVDDRRFYGPGVFFRKTSEGYNFWHLGSWRWKGNGRNDRFGAYFAAYDNGFTIAVNYSHDAFDHSIWGELDKGFWEATH